VILLDTNVLIWIIENSSRLGAEARESVGGRGPGEIAVCAISFWEIGMLLSKKRIALSRTLADFVDSIGADDRFRILPVDAAIAVEAGTLPAGIHGDPGDRMIVATARHLACPLLTSDREILAYADQGHVQALNARR
jgi:PIN domain nuclease of toxin-antitoxin system